MHFPLLNFLSMNMATCHNFGLQHRISKFHMHVIKNQKRGFTWNLWNSSHNYVWWMCRSSTKLQILGLQNLGWGNNKSLVQNVHSTTNNCYTIARYFKFHLRASFVAWVKWYGLVFHPIASLQSRLMFGLGSIDWVAPPLGPTTPCCAFQIGNIFLNWSTMVGSPNYWCVNLMKHIVI